MKTVLEFNTSPVFSPVAEEKINIALLTRLSGSGTDKAVDRMKIDGDEVELPTNVVHSLSRTLKEVSRLIETRAYIRIDCMSFGMILCGGLVSPEIYKLQKFPYAMTNSYREVADTSRGGGVPRTLEPAILGDIKKNSDPSILKPEHMVVRLSDELDLYAQKFGDGYIGIADLASSASMYGSTAVGSVLTCRLENADGQSMLRYQSEDAEHSIPHSIITAHNISVRD